METKIFQIPLGLQAQIPQIYLQTPMDDSNCNKHIRTKMIEDLEKELKDNGAIYTKQLGAGGGGFIFCLFKEENKILPYELMKLMLKPKISELGLRIL